MHEVPLAFGGYDEMLRSGEVDLVYNPLPNSLHAEWTVRSLEAGLPVLCEKPLTVNALEAAEVAAASRAAGLPVAEAFMYRFHPVYDRVVETIRQGGIGRVTAIHSRFTFRLDDWSANPASEVLGGGALRDVGCYCVNLSRLIAGCEPRRAFAMMRGAAVDHTLLGAMEFPGILAQFECSIESEERHAAEIIGTDGSILLERPWFPGEDRAEFVLCREGARRTVETPGADGYHLEAEDFARARRTRTAPRWGVEDALAGMRAVYALLESANSGAAIDIG
jgi:predicted dehydrogenase